MERFGKGKVIFQASGNKAIRYTKTEKNLDWRSVCIVNKGSETMTISIKGLEIQIDPKEQFDDNFEDFNQLDILTDVAYKLILRQ